MKRDFLFFINRCEHNNKIIFKNFIKNLLTFLKITPLIIEHKQKINEIYAQK